MCGILCIFGDKRPDIQNVLEHRGPDEFKTMQNDKCYMEFSRLSINDTTNNGMQPFCENGGMLVCNGEIYNHKEIDPRQTTQSESDCECLISIIQRQDMFEAAKKIRGVFAMCYADGEKLLAARDPIGVRPLFYTKYDTG